MLRLMAHRKRDAALFSSLAFCLIDLLRSGVRGLRLLGTHGQALSEATHQVRSKT
jgi:hypothetical protein